MGKEYILGISAFYHDSAASLLCDGKIVAAAQEERFSRVKNDAQFPKKSIEFVLEFAGIKLNEVDTIVYYDKPFITFERIIASYLTNAPRGFRSFLFSFPLWIKKKLFLRSLIKKELSSLGKTKIDNHKLLFSEHHLSHAAGSYFTSGFKEAVVLTIDAVGEWATTSVAIGKDNNLKLDREIKFPHSLGMLYSTFTSYLGFQVNEGEYKMMGLAPYGKPIYAELIKNNLIDLKSDGTFRLDMKYFDYLTGTKMFNSNFERLFGRKSRDATTEELNSFHADVAASIQDVTEEILILMTRELAQHYGIKNLCLSGGVALNCVANGKLLKDKSFENIWVQPSSGDAGASMGSALAVWHTQLNKPIRKQIQKFPSQYLGPEYSNKEIATFLNEIGAKYTVHEKDQLAKIIASELSRGKIVGWFQGRMEFGARALGNRSILADPRNPEMQKNLNLKIKFREGFRPFAPIVLNENAKDWFDCENESPYMLFVHKILNSKRLNVALKQNKTTIRERLKQIKSTIPAVTHVNYTARIQTLSKEMNLDLYNLITNFLKLTGCPMLVNTSMNVRGEPIVCSPIDAYKFFMSAELDILVLNNCILFKEEQFPVK